MTWVQRMQAGPLTITVHRLAIGSLAIKIQTLLDLLATGCYLQPCGPNKILILLKTIRIINSRPHFRALSFPTALYATSPSITVPCKVLGRGVFCCAGSFPYINSQRMTSLHLCLQLIPSGQGNQPRRRQPALGGLALPRHHQREAGVH